MIRGMDNPVVPTTLPGNTKETHPGKPDDVVQKHDTPPHLKTDGNEIQQQSVDLSSRTVTDLNADINSPLPNLREADAKVASKTNSHSVPEASKYIEQDKRPIQLNAPRKAYPGSSDDEGYSHMDNNPRSNFYATYANVPHTFELETVQIGNQELITLDTSQSYIDPALEAKRSEVESLNFSFLVDFLNENNEIKYIVDIGCGDGKKSLLMQNYLKEQGVQIKVIPVDIANAYDNGYNDNKPLPINIIPAQEIAGATPATTLFTAIRPFTEEGREAEQLIREIAEGKTDYYLTTLLKNNPGCFVLTTEDPNASSPQRYIPPEMVYTKHYHAFANAFSPHDYETLSDRQAKAARTNAENGDIYCLNQLLAKFPTRDRNIYLYSIPLIREKLQKELPKEPEQLWADNIFNSFLENIRCFEPVSSCPGIQDDLTRNNLEMRCWHVYRQDTNASKVNSQAVRGAFSSNSLLPPPHESDAEVASKTETRQKLANNRSSQKVIERFDPGAAKMRKTFETASLSQCAPETSEHIGQKRPIELNAPCKPYPGSSEATRRAHMDNTPRGNYYATYANVPPMFEPETVQIGNQELITLDTSQSFVDPDLEGDREDLGHHNFSYLVDFLDKNNEIKYIVDIGCGDGKKSLLMQNYLKEQGVQIKVIPVDIANAYDNVYNHNKPLPINIIPAQEIAGATPATTLFTAIRPFTEEGQEAEQLIREIAQGKTDYYLTTLLKNNPGCFVMTTEDMHASSPQLYIPPEMVYTKHYHAFANAFFPDDYETLSHRQAEAAKTNAENGDIYCLNRLLAKFPTINRNNYLCSIPLIRERLQKDLPEEPEQLWPEKIFNSYLEQVRIFEPVKPFLRIKYDLAVKKLEMRCWHVYRQDSNALKVNSQAVRGAFSSN
ncbi:hypothetical protein [Endozoicomonas sp. 8E]|uniref:hypothetical protein n=1 Tax=Endozoicomonas sp. 8E TaxID=3035692 RepID=UPI0029391817|nr:hypothetical protein [Endozoicomonas sp. 8E]WOG30030.1 hypothetical protein P6910_10360 [Endozoicomonas sp. 8E]